MSEETDRPILRVVSKGATPQEIAALVAVFSAIGGGSADAPAPRSLWAAPARMHRTPHRPGPGAWRASGLPR